MSTEDKTKHNGTEEAKKQNKTSHGNEVKYFTHRNATISGFFRVKTSQETFRLRATTAKIPVISLSAYNLYLNGQFVLQKDVFPKRNCLNPKVIEYSNIETLEACSRQHRRKSLRYSLKSCLLLW